jgi:hypothetical protein
MAQKIEALKARLDQLEAEPAPAHMQSTREIVRFFLEEEIAQMSQQTTSRETPRREPDPD